MVLSISLLVCQSVIKVLILDLFQLLFFNLSLTSFSTRIIILPVKGRMLTDKQASVTFI